MSVEITPAAPGVAMMPGKPSPNPRLDEEAMMDKGDWTETASAAGNTGCT
ncbi:MAG: hypothetical protein LBJ16_01965 [Holosporaceae bacterium]|jgi:hypothetical protein|nr:hypothetical protein [Holosporaceae bacterium]